MASTPQPLSDEDVEQLAAKLARLREEMHAQDAGSAAARAPVELDQQSVGRLSRIDALQQQAMAEAEARRRRSDIARIDSAFERIAAGEYGWCEQCGEPIGRPRLEVDPMAARCIRCAD